MPDTRPIAFLRDENIADEVLRLAAAASCPLERVADPVELRARWTGPPLVIVDDPADCRGLPRRESLVVVCGANPPTETWAAAMAVGAIRLVPLPADESWLVSALADAAETPAGRAGPVLAVLGGTGGAGASVFAAAVALTALAAGRATLLVDCDPLSGGLDLVLGAEHTAGLRWPDVRVKSGRVPASSLHSALPSRTNGAARLTILSGARAGEGPTAEAVSAVVAAGRRTGETVVCDLPRHIADTSAAALAHTDLAAVVVPADVRSCAAAHRVTTDLRARGIRTGLVIRGPSPSRLSPQEIATTLSVPLLANYTADRDLPRAVDRGEFTPRASLTRAARAVLTAMEGTQP